MPRVCPINARGSPIWARAVDAMLINAEAINDSTHPSQPRSVIVLMASTILREGSTDTPEFAGQRLVDRGPMHISSSRGARLTVSRQGIYVFRGASLPAHISRHQSFPIVSSRCWTVAEPSWNPKQTGWRMPINRSNVARFRKRLSFYFGFRRLTVSSHHNMSPADGPMRRRKTSNSAMCTNRCQASPSLSSQCNSRRLELRSSTFPVCVIVVTTLTACRFQELLVVNPALRFRWRKCTKITVRTTV